MTPAQRGWIEAALKYADGAYEISDVLDGIVRGDMALLADEACALVFEIVSYPRLRALNVMFAGGDLQRIKALDPLLADIAKKHGCSRIYVSGRLGWLRALRGLGYGELSAITSKEV